MVHGHGDVSLYMFLIETRSHKKALKNYTLYVFLNFVSFAIICDSCVQTQETKPLKVWSPSSTFSDLLLSLLSSGSHCNSIRRRRRRRRVTRVVGVALTCAFCMCVKKLLYWSIDQNLQWEPATPKRQDSHCIVWKFRDCLRVPIFFRGLDFVTTLLGCFIQGRRRAACLEQKSQENPDLREKSTQILTSSDAWFPTWTSLRLALILWWCALSARSTASWEKWWQPGFIEIRSKQLHFDALTRGDEDEDEADCDDIDLTRSDEEADCGELSRRAAFRYAKEAVGTAARLAIVAAAIAGAKNLQRKLSTNRERRNKSSPQ